MLFIFTGMLARYDAAGLEIRTWRRGWRAFAWRDVRLVKVVANGQTLKIEFRGRPSMSLPHDCGGLRGLVEAAETAGVPGAADLLAGKPVRP